MPHFDIIKEVKPAKTFRVASVMGTFDLQESQVKEHFVGDIDLPERWQIGLIVGNSGTGKTTIAKELFPQAYITKYEYNAETILDDMPKSATVDDISKTFSSVGFSSPPSWLKPYNVLSNGEKMRVDIARAILDNKELVVFDEFTSVVDRTVAKVSSYAIQKAIRRSNKKFIAVGCHFDVEDWLLPDWVFNTNTMTFRLCEGQKKNRPKCELRIYETKQKYFYWSMFKKYHYLSHEHNNAARVFLATLDGELCAFFSVLPFPHPIVKNKWKCHRIVVLPDFQGIGIGSILMDNIGEIYKENGKQLLIVTSSPSMISCLKKSKKWIITRKGRLSAGSKTGHIHNRYNRRTNGSFERITVSAKYVG